MNPLVTQGVNTGLGILTGAIQDQRHFNMQKKMNTEQVKNSRQLMDYQQIKQLEMWEKTGYAPQMEQMKKAGINPALMYGMGGGGGQSTGNISATGQGGHAREGGNIAGSIGMGIQAALTQAQIKNLESQAKLNEVEANKRAGIDTAESQARIDQLLQGVDNQKQQHQLMKLEATLKQIENFEKQATQENRLEYIEYQTRQAMKHLEIVTNEAFISSTTINDKIKIIGQEAIGAVIRNQLTKAQIQLNAEQITNLKETIKQGWDRNLQGWQSLDQEKQKIAIQKFEADLKAKFPALSGVHGMAVYKTMQAILSNYRIPHIGRAE